MNRIILLFIALATSAAGAVAQNIFTFADNGTFEGASWEDDLRTFNASVSNTRFDKLERSQNHAYGGSSYSLRVVEKVHPNSAQSYRSLAFPFENTTGSFGASLYVYFPADENPQLSGAFFPMEVVSSSKTTSGTTRCVATGYPQMKLDTWLKINPVLINSIYLYLYAPVDRQLVYYIDNVEAVASTPIADNVVLSDVDNSIRLAPSGGMTVLPGNEHGPNVYTYTWSDLSTNTPTRTNLAGGVIYTVQIVSQLQGSSNCNVSNIFRYIVNRPTPPTTTGAVVCAGVSAQLTATGAPSGNYYQYSWYDAATGGNKLGTGTIFQTGGLMAGMHRFYAQIDITGTVKGLSSYRTETVVTVNTIPAPQLVVPAISFERKGITITASNHQPGNAYVYRFYYGANTSTAYEEVTTTGSTLSYTFIDRAGYPAIGTHAITVHVTGTGGCASDFTRTTTVRDVVPLCETRIPRITDADAVKLDNFSGLFVFQRNQQCTEDVRFACIQTSASLPIFSNVVAASTQTFSDQWRYTAVEVPGDGNAVERGEVGKWRGLSSYIYNKGKVSVGDNFSAGTFDLSYFNWQYPEASSRGGWLRISEVTRYSPNGESLEERDALGLFSAAKFGYNSSLPYLVARNGDYNSVFFESFENVYTISGSRYLEDQTPAPATGRDENFRHSGNASFRLLEAFTTRAFARSEAFEKKGLLIRVWAAGTEPAKNLKLSVNGVPSVGTTDFEYVGRSGTWMLLEARIEPNVLLVADNETFSLQLSSHADVWIDDIRVQPQDGEMACYVYDPETLRVLTIFDDQHFGTYYQYNDEGKLVRKSIETERGKKTLQEVHYNTPEIEK